MTNCKDRDIQKHDRLASVIIGDYLQRIEGEGEGGYRMLNVLVQGAF